MMTLDEAIGHAEWCAENSCGECADDHRQLADWLRELRRARMEIDLLKTLRDGFKADARKYEAENASLRGAAQGLGELCDTLEAQNAKLRELARKNWFIVLSERDALRIHGVDPDGGAYITALDMTMDESRATMRELGIEVEE